MVSRTGEVNDEILIGRVFQGTARCMCVLKMVEMESFLSIITDKLCQYKTSVLILSGTGKFVVIRIERKEFYVYWVVLTGWLVNKFWINRRLLLSEENLAGKTVLITGSNCGIGYETAKDLLKRSLPIEFYIESFEKDIFL